MAYVPFQPASFVIPMIFYQNSIIITNSSEPKRYSLTYVAYVFLGIKGVRCGVAKTVGRFSKCLTSTVILPSTILSFKSRIYTLVSLEVAIVTLILPILPIELR